VRAKWLLARLWYWFSGLAHHGGRVDGRLTRGRLAAWRTGGTLAVALTVFAWLVNPQVTGRVVAGGLLLAVAVLAWLGWRWVRSFRHRRVWLRPLHLRLAQVAGIPLSAAPQSWLEVAPDRSSASLALPAGFSGDAKQRALIAETAAAAIGLEAPEASWHLAGPKPMLMLAASMPPPARVTLADVRGAIERARADELIWGLGKRSAVVSSSLSGDSPHIGLSMGSGAGKSVTARGLVAPMLYRGCIALFLDYKMISHQWAAGLPNVVIARRPHEIHDALLWLGGEVERRNEVALAGADLDGNVHAVVGPRLIVVCEELNATVGRLRAYWRQQRAGDRDLPQRSPALEALDAASFMGRQVQVNIIYIGQRLSVKASGGDGDARENIGVIAFGRYSASNWKMLAGDHPMPPSSRAPGRIQVVDARVRETQGVFMTAREARELAVAGEVAALPAGMPGARVSKTSELVVISGPGQAFVPETRPVVPSMPGLVTLAEAVTEGVVSCSLAALRKAPQRDPEFPRRKGFRGIAGEYDAAELAEWDAARR
jgi:hypothetical protein